MYFKDQKVYYPFAAIVCNDYEINFEMILFSVRWNANTGRVLDAAPSGQVTVPSKASLPVVLLPPRSASRSWQSKGSSKAPCFRPLSPFSFPTAAPVHVFPRAASSACCNLHCI